MNIAQRLALLLSVPLLVLAGLAVFIHLQLATIAAQGRNMANIQVPTLAVIGNVTRAYSELRVEARDYIVATSPGSRAVLANHFQATEAEMNRLFDYYVRILVVEEQDRQLLENFRRLAMEWTAGARVAMSEADRGQTTEAYARLGGRMRDVADSLHAASEEWIRYNERAADKAGAAMVGVTDAARMRLWVAGAAALLVTAGLGILTFRRIVRPIQSLETAVKTIAAGDYQKPVPYVDARDETGSLARSVEVLKQGAAQSRQLLDQTRSQADRLQAQTAELSAQREQLLQSEQRLQNILDQSPTSISISTEGRLRFANPRAFEIFGLKLGDATPQLYVRPEERTAIDAELKAGRAVVDFEIQMYDRAHRVRDMLVTYLPLTYEGKPGILAWLFDITNLKQQEAELKRINLQSDTALDLTKTNYWHLSFDEPEWFYSNARGAQLLGQEPVPNFRYCLADWAEQVRLGDATAAGSAAAAFDAMVAGRSQHYNATYAYKRPSDGRVIWLRSSGHVVRDAEGRPKEIFGVNQDITEAYLAEQAIKEGEQALRQANFLADMALELTKSGYWRIDYSDPDYYYQSERAAKIVGEEMKPDGRYHLQTEWFSRLIAADPELARQTGQSYQDAVDGKVQGYDAIYPYKRPSDGQIVWLHAAGSLERGPDGQVRYMYGVYQDITEIKRAEHELAFRLSFQRALLDTIPYPMFFKDAAGRFAGCNKAYEREFATTAEFLNGKTVLELEYLPEEERRKFHEEDMAVIRAAGRRSYELPIRWADGTIHITLYSVDGFRLADGTDGGLIGLLVDITDQKRVAEELRAARAKAEEATQMKSMFLANMSHEIRTPMNAIIGLSYLALKTALTAKQRDYVAKVHNAGTSLLAIINDILDFSKIEAGRLDLESVEFKLDDVISSVTTVTAQKANEKGLEFLASITPGLPPSLVGDPLRLGQILTNLINNSIKFTEQGEVKLTVDVAEMTGEKCQLRCSIRDTGMGMNPEQAARLFQPFTQADMSTTRKHGGTGLGLTICRRLVELMGGQIWFESEPGIGTTFTFTIWTGVGSRSGARKLIPEKIGRLRALIVDDNAAAREIADGLLQDIVQQIDSVASAPEALSAIRQNDADAPYDVVFMDWRMPGMDGLQAARAIKGDPTIRHQPVIIMVTAFGREEVRDEAEELKLDGFLVKPVTKSMVVDSLIHAFVHAGETAAVAASAMNEGIALPGMRILLVEDNDINQQIAVELLEGVGASVTVANHGGEALDFLTGEKEPPFDVVLMDLQMPVMDGRQATARIRADNRFAALPIIAMTAHATMEERDACLAIGMNGHISKPIDPGLLFATLVALRRPDAIASCPTPRPAVAQGSLPVIAGMDTVDGLARVAGNEKLYLKLLRQFSEQQPQTVAQISSAQARGDIATAERLAHTLQGVAGNLGAKSVQSAAAALEKLLRDRTTGDAVVSALQHLASRLDPVLAGLRASLPQAAAPAATVVLDPAASRAAAVQLAKLLADFDAATLEFVEANQPLLRPLFSEKAWASFQGHIQGYAFSDALTLLHPVASDPKV